MREVRSFKGATPITGNEWQECTSFFPNPSKGLEPNKGGRGKSRCRNLLEIFPQKVSSARISVDRRLIQSTGPGFKGCEFN